MWHRLTSINEVTLHFLQGGTSLRPKLPELWENYVLKASKKVMSIWRHVGCQVLRQIACAFYYLHAVILLK